jgi:hypothetical protein
MKTMIIAGAAVLALSVGQAAYAEGRGWHTATGALWQAQNGNAQVPANAWFAATPDAAGSPVSPVSCAALYPAHQLRRSHDDPIG